MSKFDQSGASMCSFVGFGFGAPWAEIWGLEVRVETVVVWGRGDSDL